MKSPAIPFVSVKCSLSSPLTKLLDIATLALSISCPLGLVTSMSELIVLLPSPSVYARLAPSKLVSDIFA